MANTLTGLINLVYPLECQGCRVSLGPFKEDCLCDECRNKISLNLAPFCITCGRSLQALAIKDAYCQDCVHMTYYFDRTWAAGHYSGILKECIHSFKFKGKISLLPVFTDLVFNFVKHHIKIGAFDILVPVPLHRVKMRERGFDHVKLLAEGFSDKVGLPICENNLIKVKYTRPQMDLPRKNRFSNLTGAFKVMDPYLVKEKNVLLMDDVFTTGSTLNECAKILQESGASSVACLVLARG